MSADGYPPMPWALRIRGTAVATFHRVEVDRARAFVPPEVRILSPWPGWTVGGLFLAEYGPGSDLEYRELIAGCATVLHRGRPCLWATHLFVDEPASVEGGRRLLGVPKALAPITREGGQRSRIVVGSPDRVICRATHGRPLWLWRQRLRIGALHRDVRDPSGATVQAHGNELRGRFGLVRAEVEIPEGSPLSALGLGDPVLSGCVRDASALFGGAPYLPRHALSTAPDPGGRTGGDEAQGQGGE